ncbi:unnamed protein product, partial [Meganyctiphanes norvegica]
GLFNSLPSHPNLKYYETIHSSAFNHQIVKRGLKDSTHRFNKIKEVSFNALGRDFRLILNPRKGLLDPQFKAYAVDGEGNEKLIQVDHENFYEGRVFGEMSSEVTAHLEDGMMTATIHTPDDTYHVEPSWRHIPEAEDETMIVYRGSDVKYSWEDHPSHTHGGNKMCDFVKEGHHNDSHFHDHKHQDYQEVVNKDYSESPSEPEGHTRVKRQQAEAYNFNGEKTRCPLLLVADYRFFREMGGQSYKTTVNYL